MKLKKDLDKCNKKELLDFVFTLVDEEAFEEEEINELSDLDEDELRELVKNLININEEINKAKEDTKECDGNCKCEEDADKDDVEVMANQLALNEEMIRQENLYDKEFDASEETKNTEIYQEMIVMAESVVAGLRVLVSGGVDYNNALSLCSQVMLNKQNSELAKYNYVQTQNNQI